MSEIPESHLKGLGELVAEKQRLTEENRILRQQKEDLIRRIERIAMYATAISSIASGVPDLPAIFSQSTREPQFSIRLYRCLNNANLRTIGDVVRKTEQEILRTKNFGRKPLNELKEVLSTQGLWLGMTNDEILAWLPPNPAQPLFPE
jgi:DNA-directed RNA polymerase alpha subunit